VLFRSAMRLVPGTDLRQLLQAEAVLEPSRALAICRQVANALDAAHARALVHRDVKPSNVLLDESDHVYLADFGLTRRLEEHAGVTGESRSVGTPAYVAPEQIEAKAVDGRADVYSLGCVLFECLTGRPPYVRDSRLQVAWAHLEEDPPNASELNPGLPKALDAVLSTALAKEPHDRYSSCVALIAAAENALGVHPAGGSRRRVAMVVGTVLIALAAVVAVVLATGNRSGGEQSSSVLFGEPNTAVRIDPQTNRVSAVIEVGQSPSAVAADEGRVWVYNRGEATVSEIDPVAKAVRKTTRLSAKPAHMAWYDGPVLAAEAHGGWTIGADPQARYVLTRVLPNARGKVEYRLAYEPRAVAVGAGAVWVLCRGRRDLVLRIDPGTGGISAKTFLPTFSSVTGLGVGAGAVWVVGSSPPTLYRIDAHSAKLRGAARLPGRATPPRVAFGSVWVAMTEHGGEMILVDPQTLVLEDRFSAEPPDEGREVAGFGSEWVLDSPSGYVARFHHQPGGGLATATIRVVRTPEQFYGLPLTSMAAGAGGIWATVAPSPFD